MNNILIVNNDRSLMIHFFNFQYEIDCIRFELELASTIFKVSTTAYAELTEINEFRKSLKQMQNKEIKTFCFSPLGAHWSLDFLLSKDYVGVKGNFSDLERIQSNLDFYGKLNIRDLLL